MSRNLFRPLILGLLTLAVFGCVPDGNHHPVGGSSGGTVSAQGGVSYDSVKPIFAGVCAKCHSSGRPPDWLDYADAKKNALNGKLASRVVTAKDMPPPSDAAAALITQKDRDLIDAWVKAGAPEHAVVATSVPGGASGAEVGGMPMPAFFRGQPLSSFVQKCSQCHGTSADASGSASDIPRLVGLSREYILAQLVAFRSGVRLDPTNTMNKMVASPAVRPEQLEDAADYYGSLAPKVISYKEVRDEDLNNPKYLEGQKIAGRSCVQCHMNPGPNDVLVPLINGQSEEYLTNQLKYFKNPYRSHSIMVHYAEPLNETDIENLSFFFSATRTRSH